MMTMAPGMEGHHHRWYAAAMDPAMAARYPPDPNAPMIADQHQPDTSAFFSSTEASRYYQMHQAYESAASQGELDQYLRPGMHAMKHKKRL